MIKIAKNLRFPRAFGLTLWVKNGFNFNNSWRQNFFDFIMILLGCSIFNFFPRRTTPTTTKIGSFYTTWKKLGHSTQQQKKLQGWPRAFGLTLRAKLIKALFHNLSRQNFFDFIRIVLGCTSFNFFPRRRRRRTTTTTLNSSQTCSPQVKTCKHICRCAVLRR